MDNFRENIPTGLLMMKIDVEGFEKEVMKGGEKLFNERENSILIIELLVEINGRTVCKEIKDILTRFNFKEVYKINSTGGFEFVNDCRAHGDYIFLKGITATKDFNLLKKYAQGN
ncbi:FkbM family methyltransferase [Flavobacterium sp. SLB02]|uniref:FkbM family methyltransferase n=1 Tax=Flavobacterium sp. SLB02 TaxID=2665645 RepID=UPI001ABF8F67|nr:FkbM family methyltransferase [Flavobacterium sp. SLB02]